MRNINLKDAKYICYTWGGGEGWYVTEKRGFLTYERAAGFASNASLAPSILEVSVMTTGDDAQRVAVFQKGLRSDTDRDTE